MTLLKANLYKKGLTSRQVEVCIYVGRGLQSSMIADEMNITIKSVKFHLTNIYKTLGFKKHMGLNPRSQLIMLVLNNGK